MQMEQTDPPAKVASNDQLGHDIAFKLDALWGRCEVRAWLEAEVMPTGELRLVGMGSRTDYDRDGRLTAHKCEPTGAVAYWPAPERRGWFARLLGA
jgi:hypothetical protein